MSTQQKSSKELSIEESFKPSVKMPFRDSSTDRELLVNRSPTVEVRALLRPRNLHQKEPPLIFGPGHFGGNYCFCGPK
ncbi:hypothetical protein CEXT_261631 [Caerostris extrusa]|uniref:Uncharacterized protein n=1 Tax=Caerostris extrusa TaxID=172846 RepID=A0AAV4RTY8_CAEEX|nr:hypothetical protein CEXT_261631 [Caerostris extrusa]